MTRAELLEDLAVRGLDVHGQVLVLDLDGQEPESCSRCGSARTVPADGGAQCVVCGGRTCSATGC